MQNRIEKTIELNAPLSKVWNAIADYKQFGEWFRVKLDGPFKVGEVSTGHITYPGYEKLKWHATIKTIEPETYFAFSWHPYAIDQDRDYSHETPTLVEFKLEARGKGTDLTIIESGFENVPEDRRFEAFRRNEGGWTTQIQNIKAYVS